MQAFAESGQIGIIVVKDLSRFGRNYLEVGKYLEITYPTLGIRFIAIQENVDTYQNGGTEMMPFHNIFNEWYAAQTSKKIRAVWKSKADRGERISPTIPYGYMKSPDNPKQWIIDEDTFNRVQELRNRRRRNTATGRTSLFSGLTYCADCGSKLYFCASKSIEADKEFFRCSAYKDNTGSCTIHFIRNVVIEQIVLEAIQKVAEYISQFEPVFLYLFAKKHKLTKVKDLKNAKFKLEQSKARVDEIDRVLTKLYEDNALGKITDERFEKLSATYEKEQRELADNVLKAETDITEAEKDNVDLKHFLKTIRACTDLKELTPEIVNTLIKRINVHNAEKVDGRKKVKIDIEFIAVGLISIPDEKELLSLMDEIRNEKSA